LRKTKASFRDIGAFFIIWWSGRYSPM
jgi:hypothetical protein